MSCKLCIFISTVLVLSISSFQYSFSQVTALVFPQLADGGGYTFEILLSNPGSTEESGTVFFWKSDGIPQEILINGTSNSSIPYAIPSGGVLKISSGGAGVLKVGYATVVSNQEVPSITGSVVYLSGGNEISVPNAPPSRQNHVFIEYTETANSGFAVANPNNATATTTAVLVDQGGISQGETPITLLPGRQTAQFVNQLFPGVAADFLGSLHLYADYPISIMGVRLKSSGELAVLPGSQTVIPSLRNLKFVTGSKDGVHEFTLDGGSRRVIQYVARYIDVFNNKLYAKQNNGDIFIYNFDYEQIATIDVPSTTSWWEFVVVSEDRIALVDHETDSVTFVSSTGEVLAEVPMIPTPDENLQALSPVVAGNRLVVLDGGNFRTRSINLDTYEVTEMRSSRMGGFVSVGLTFANGRFYASSFGKIYSFVADETETLLASIPDCYVRDILVRGKSALVSDITGNAIYQVDLETGAYSKIVSGLTFPTNVRVAGE